MCVIYVHTYNRNFIALILCILVCAVFAPSQISSPRLCYKCSEEITRVDTNTPTSSTHNQLHVNTACTYIHTYIHTYVRTYTACRQTKTLTKCHIRIYPCTCVSVVLMFEHIIFMVASCTPYYILRTYICVH